MKNKLLVRTATGLIFVLVLLGGMMINAYVFFGVFLLIQIFSLREFYKLFDKTNIKPQIAYGLLIGTVVFTVVFLAENKITDNYIYIILVPLLIFLPIMELYKRSEKNIENIAITLMGVVYVAIPFSLFNILSINEFTSNKYDYSFLLAFFIFIWSNDTGAYLSGSTFGKNKLFERISPKKTWEGLIGGLLVALIAGYVISLFFDDLNLIQWLFFAGIVSIFGTFGDLSESMIKRRLGIKDSGTLLPGHGGLLDRFDSALLAAPAVFFYIKMLEYLS